MAEDLQITEGSKEEKYQSLIPQIKGLVDGETDLTANLANICAALKSTFHFFWVGFYQVKEDQDVDAFPGHIACSSLSRSEIVVPVMVDDKVWGVLDVDSEALAFFDETDKKYLEYLCDEIVAKVTK